jgi:uncharacterized protein (DUF1697 family)
MAVRPYVALLRGVNLGSSRRVPMAALREMLTQQGYENVSTLLQSGNVVLVSALAAGRLEQALERQLGDWLGFEVEVLVRSGKELSAILAADPLRDVATDPTRYLVTFLRRKPRQSLVESLAGSAKGRERVVAVGRELFSWHPEGVGRSDLAKRLQPKGLGVSATARNWRTVEQLASLASGRA